MLRFDRNEKLEATETKEKVETIPKMGRRKSVYGNVEERRFSAA